MAIITNKRKILSVERKVKVIRQIVNGKNEASLCREFGFITSTIQMIWTNRTKIISVFEQNESRSKRFHDPTRSDVDEALLKWFKQERNDKVLVRGPLLTITLFLTKF